MSLAMIRNIGGIELVDLNPDQNDNDPYPANTDPSINGLFCIGVGPASGVVSYIPVCGYKFVKFKNGSTNSTIKWRFVFADGTVEPDSSLRTESYSSTWPLSYIPVPQNAIGIQVYGYFASHSWIRLNYSFIT